MDNFTIGDQVIVLDEVLEGRVIGVRNDQVVLVDSLDGFQYTYPKSSLIRKKEMDLLGSFERQKEGLKASRRGCESRFRGTVIEEDLHLDEAEEAIRGGDELRYQLEKSRKAFRKLVGKKIKKVILIHGVGRGVLRESLYSVIQEEFPELEAYPASYERYGQGALEVRVRQKGGWADKL